MFFVLASIILSYDVALCQLVVKLAEAKAKIRRKCVISKFSSRVGQVLACEEVPCCVKL